MGKYKLHNGETIHAAYRRIAGEQDLFGVAFFGHGCANARAARNARRRLDYAWRQLLSQGADEIADRAMAATVPENVGCEGMTKQQGSAIARNILRGASELTQ